MNCVKKEKIAIQENIGESGSLLYARAVLYVLEISQSPGFVIKLGPHAAIG